MCLRNIENAILYVKLQRDDAFFLCFGGIYKHFLKSHQSVAGTGKSSVSKRRFRELVEFVGVVVIAVTDLTVDLGYLAGGYGFRL